MIRQFLLRWFINFIGLWAAAWLLSGVNYDNVSVLIWASLIFSIVNAMIRPIVIVLSLPAIVLTLGLFTFVVNALMLYLVTVLYDPFQVASFWQAILAVLVVWITNYLFTSLMEGARREGAI